MKELQEAIKDYDVNLLLLCVLNKMNMLPESGYGSIEIIFHNGKLQYINKQNKYLLNIPIKEIEK